MQIASNQSYTRFRVAGFHNLPKREEPTPARCDVQTFLGFLENVTGNFLVIRSLSSSQGYGTYSVRTAKAAIKKGYHDIDGWAYVNAVHKIKKTYYDKKGILRFTSETVSSKIDGNVVFDFDDVPNAETERDMLKLITDKGLPPPILIVKTSHRSFHVLYLGSYGTWTTQKKLEYAFKFIGKDVPEVITPSDISKLKAAGIDYNYLLQNTDMCKIRIPGSVRLSMSGVFICTYLYVPEGYTDVNKLVLGDVNTASISRPNKQRKVAKKTDKFYSSHMDSITSLLAPHLPKKHLTKFAQHLTTHLGFLFRDKCQLSQIEISKVIGASQPTVSRIIRTLVKAGVLSVMLGGYYHYKKNGTGRPKTYGAGPALKKVLKMVDEKMVRRQLAMPYEAGKTNSSMLKDIGIMYKCGFTDEDIVRICDQKMRARGGNRKSRREIYRAVVRWGERQEGVMTRPSKPIIDPGSILVIAGAE